MKVSTVTIQIKDDTGDIKFTTAIGWEEKFVCTPQTHEQYLKAVKIRDENKNIKESLTSK